MRDASTKVYGVLSSLYFLFHITVSAPRSSQIVPMCQYEYKPSNIPAAVLRLIIPNILG